MNARESGHYLAPWTDAKLMHKQEDADKAKSHKALGYLLKKYYKKNQTLLTYEDASPLSPVRNPVQPSSEFS